MPHSTGRARRWERRGSYLSERTNEALRLPRATSATGPCIVRLKSGETSIVSVPPGIRTTTGLATRPRRTAALAAVQDDDPDACVSPAPRSQIRHVRHLVPVVPANCTLVRFGKIE